HRQVTDGDIGSFAFHCLKAWGLLTHVIFVRAVQPNEIENNGSRISNKWYQRSSDAQFKYWLDNFFGTYEYQYLGTNLPKPKVLVIDFWDLEERKNLITKFLKGESY